MPIVSRRLIGVVILAPMICLACGSDRDDTKEKEKETGGAAMTARDTTRHLGPGDVMISTTDSSFDLALIGDSVVTRFGKKVLDNIRGNTDTAKVSGNGFAASIEKAVKSGVATAMGSELHLPISDMSDVRYAGGELQFFAKDGSKMHLLENSHENGKQVSKMFSESDAQRFIAAFKARKSSGA